MNTYSIIRFYADPNTPKETRQTGLTLEEAREHCNGPESSSRTCSEHVSVDGGWFDGYEEE